MQDGVVEGVVGFVINSCIKIIVPALAGLPRRNRTQVGLIAFRLGWKAVIWIAYRALFFLFLLLSCSWAGFQSALERQIGPPEATIPFWTEWWFHFRVSWFWHPSPPANYSTPSVSRYLLLDSQCFAAALLLTPLIYWFGLTAPSCSLSLVSPLSLVLPLSLAILLISPSFLAVYLRAYWVCLCKSILWLRTISPGFLLFLLLSAQPIFIAPSSILPTVSVFHLFCSLRWLFLWFSHPA